MKPLIAGNWKMHKTREQAESFFASMRDQDFSHADVLLCPSFTLLDLAHRSLEGTGILLGAQDTYVEPEGAFTGEISPTQLRDIGCSHVLIGHSERRHVLGESDDLVRRKLHAAITNGLIPILCVGENEDEREEGMTQDVLARQLSVLDGVTGNFEIAYEPVWAIGTGKSATPEMAQEAHRFIRELTRGRGSCRILYGGSVKPENAKALLSQTDVDGFLVGGASLDASSFLSIISP